MLNSNLSKEDRAKLMETKKIGDEAGRMLQEANNRVNKEREETLRVLKRIKKEE